MSSVRWKLIIVMALDFHHFQNAFLDAHPPGTKVTGSPSSQNRSIGRVVRAGGGGPEGGLLGFAEGGGDFSSLRDETDAFGNDAVTAGLLGVEEEDEDDEEDNDVDDDDEDEGFEFAFPELPDLDGYFESVDATAQRSSQRSGLGGSRKLYPIKPVQLEAQARLLEPEPTPSSPRKRRGVLVDPKRRKLHEEQGGSPRPRLHLTLREHVS